MIAVTHVPSPEMGRGQRTYVSPSSINLDRAVKQHEAYRRMLSELGAEVITLDVNREMPDSVFVEDTAIVLDEVAIMTPMGAESRRKEPAGIEKELEKYREIQRIELPATIEGGDVLRAGRRLLAGISSRTNLDGIKTLESIVAHYGYGVLPVHVQGCLHLKTACSALPDGRLLVNPNWLSVSALSGFEIVTVPREEPWAANVALIGDTVCLDADHGLTAGKIRNLGFAVRTVDISEFAKAEGGVTCLSLLFQ